VSQAYRMVVISKFC